VSPEPSTCGTVACCWSQIFNFVSCSKKMCVATFHALHSVIFLCIIATDFQSILIGKRRHIDYNLLLYRYRLNSCLTKSLAFNCYEDQTKSSEILSQMYVYRVWCLVLSDVTKIAVCQQRLVKKTTNAKLRENSLDGSRSNQRVRTGMMKLTITFRNYFRSCLNNWIKYTD